MHRVCTARERVSPYAQPLPLRSSSPITGTCRNSYSFTAYSTAVYSYSHQPHTSYLIDFLLASKCADSKEHDDCGTQVQLHQRSGRTVWDGARMSRFCGSTISVKTRGCGCTGLHGQNTRAHTALVAWRKRRGWARGRGRPYRGSQPVNSCP